MKKLLPILLVGLGCLVAGSIAGFFGAAARNESRVDRIVAMSWGGGRYGEAFYGAHVYLVPVKDGYSVRGRVYIGRGREMYQDCGELGRAATDKEAVKNWGSIDWREDGLHIGDYYLPRETLERHR
jgi:hypothetical protein